MTDASPAAAASRLRFPTYQRDARVHPPYDFPEYGSTRLRAPRRPLILLPHNLTEVTGTLLGAERVGDLDHDLTRQHEHEPLGQRIIVHGRVLDSDGHPIRHSLVEVWQTNAAGRYRHAADTWAAPLDPNFTGVGRTMTDDQGHYRFVSIKPGAYPWRNHHNAWRPAHLHFSLFGRAFVQRLVTQMYFPDDPLIPFDPILNSIPDEAGRRRLIARFDYDATQPEWALAFAFDIVLRGREGTPFQGGST